MSLLQIYLSTLIFTLYYVVIPKELAKQCRNGCPANIEQFCLTWKRLQNCM